MSEVRLRQFATIHLATDHAGLALKDSVRAWLIAENWPVIDHGAYQYLAEDDYPDFVLPAARAVAASAGGDAAIVFGGSGQGEAMAANRVKGVRAAVYYGAVPTLVSLSREHNDANVLALGARFVTEADAKQVIWEWLHTSAASDEKYARRNHKLDVSHSYDV